MAVSTNKAAVVAFGIPDDALHVFSFWDFVGGRYSVWSTVGLSIAIAYGHSVFLDFLQGGALIDSHFYGTINMQNNIPVVMGLLGIWYNNFCGAETQAILPYEQLLKEFPAYLQQLEMESNGKSAGRLSVASTHHSQGEYHKVGPCKAARQTGQIIWGQVGTNGQHAFYQLLHQGTKFVPIDFLGGRKSRTLPGVNLDYQRHHRTLIVNMIAQSEALLCGSLSVGDAGSKNSSVDEGNNSCLSRPSPDNRNSTIDNGYNNFKGNKPSSVLLYDSLNAKTLGALVALYEHKVFVMGHLMNIHSFDQWGVELGKKLARMIENGGSTSHDASTLALLNQLSVPS